MPQGTNRIWYLTVILSHNNLFVPHWHYTLIYGLPVQIVTFLSETKYTWIVHFYLANHLSVHTIWQIWIQDPHHNLYHWALPHIKDIVDGYLISIPTRHNLSRSLHFLLSGTWTFFKILWSVMSMCSFIELASLSWPYWSFAPSFFKEFYIWNQLVYYAFGVS